MTLTLRDRIVYTKWALWLGAVVAALALAQALHWSPFFFFPVVVLVVALAPRYVGLRVVRRAYGRLAVLVDAENFSAARAVLAELHELYLGSRSVSEGLRLQEATIRSLEGRYGDAAALLASLDAAHLGEAYRPLLLNNLAWALALSGQPVAAVARARESLEASERAGDKAMTRVDLRAYQLGTLGTALVLSGDAAEGLPLLEQALARGGKPREQAARRFFVGEGLRALGRHEEAASAYARAAEEAPGSRFGTQAKAALEGLRAYRS